MNSKFDITKMYIKDIFNNNKSYIVPSYQRAYVWGREEITELLDDLEDFFIKTYKGPGEQINDDYFIGSIVLCSIGNKTSKYYILDGQQRLTTILIIWLCLIDLIIKSGFDKDEKYTFSETLNENKLAYINEKMGAMKSNVSKRCRITFETRVEVNKVLLKLIDYSQKGKIEEFLMDSEIKYLAKSEPTIQTIYHGVRYIQAYIKQNKENFKDKSIYSDPIKLYEFMFTVLLNNISFAQINADSLNDAYKLFTIINNRGVKLTNADILKTINLQFLANDHEEEEVKPYAQKWEKIESHFFKTQSLASKMNLDQFLDLIKIIYVKEAGKKSLYAWYEEDIFKIKKARNSKALIHPGEEFINKMERFFNIYLSEIELQNIQSQTKDIEYQNTIKIMNKYINDGVWKAAVLMFADKFEDEINESKEDLKTQFITLLENYFTFFWITLQTRSQVFTKLVIVLNLIEQSNTVKEVLESQVWYSEYNENELSEALKGNIFKTKYGRYIMFRYEKILCGNKSITESSDKVTIEHILPQTMDGKWKDFFTYTQHQELVHKIGNLTILDQKDNTKLSNNDIEEKIAQIKNKFRDFIVTRQFISYIEQHSKKEKFSDGNIVETLQWTPELINARGADIITEILRDYKKLNKNKGDI
ncbi:DUF262 domain-containing protein [Mycoplasma sp. 654]|uniref:DUF262 domain-containing protein n=1 Tax=Mycoplasma sp. 654 TaxID=3398773 RepID=UPI003A849BCB